MIGRRVAAGAAAVVAACAIGCGGAKQPVPVPAIPQTTHPEAAVDRGSQPTVVIRTPRPDFEVGKNAAMAPKVRIRELADTPKHCEDFRASWFAQHPQ